MWPLQRKTVLILSAAILLLIVIVVGLMVFGGNETGDPNQKASNLELEGFTFFDIGANSVYAEAMRDRLGEKLGTSVVETRGLIDLTINYQRFFDNYFPQLYRLHQQLNDDTGARVEHNIIKLTFRYAQRKNSPFFYVELVFSEHSKNPLFFRIKSKKEGADIVGTIKNKYGKAIQIEPSETDDMILFWKEHKDHLVILTTKDRFGEPEYHIMIYYVDNIEKLITIELEEKKGKAAAKKKAGQTAF